MVRKTSCFGLKCWFSSPQSQLEMSKLPVKHISFYRHKHGCIFFRDLFKYTCFFVCFFPHKTAGDVPTSCQNHPVVGSCLYPAVSHLQKLKPQTRSLTYLLSYSYKLTWAYQLLAETLSANVLSWRLRLSSAWWWFSLTWKMDFGVYPRMNTDPFKCFKPNRLQTI